jgi:hypothetical protein
MGFCVVRCTGVPELTGKKCRRERPRSCGSEECPRLLRRSALAPQEQRHSRLTLMIALRYPWRDTWDGKSEVALADVVCKHFILISGRMECTNNTHRNR